MLKRWEEWHYVKYETDYTVDLTVNNSNYGLVCYVHFHKNTFKKGMNLSVPSILIPL